mmetsp:Transcript_27901/g.73598  ORF Transcript_27901/g.73598 Transcript_27901/m.73598 type:complete len:85 (-) Transcript_27901:95-349(-)
MLRVPGSLLSFTVCSSGIEPSPDLVISFPAAKYLDLGGGPPVPFLALFGSFEWGQLRQCSGYIPVNHGERHPNCSIKSLITRWK